MKVVAQKIHHLQWLLRSSCARRTQLGHNRRFCLREEALISRMARNRRHFFARAGTNGTPRRVTRPSRFAASFSANCNLPFFPDSLICPACPACLPLCLAFLPVCLPIAGPSSSFRTTLFPGSLSRTRVASFFQDTWPGTSAQVRRRR